MTAQRFFNALFQLAIAAAVLLLAHYNLGWLAAVLVVIPPMIMWLRGGRSSDSLRHQVPTLVLGLSVVTLISLNQQPVGQPVLPVSVQVILALLYAGWLMTAPQALEKPNLHLSVAGLSQFLAISAIFLAAAFWHWLDIAVVALTWTVSYSLAWWLLGTKQERASQILAATWALVAAEVAWVLYSWQVNYELLNSYLIVPQAAIILVGLGYCFASIYLTHAGKRLSRRRLIEYVAIAGVLLAIVIAGTRWNGTT